MSLHLLTPLANQAPQAEDVTAGWIAAVVLVSLLLAVVFLGFSLVKHLKKAQAAEDAGVYGNVPDEPDPDNAGSANERRQRQQRRQRRAAPHRLTGDPSLTNDGSACGRAKGTLRGR